MTTPLFPANDTQIVIKQSTISDCYLLAALDCIFNIKLGGYQLIKSLFTETDQGVIVRLPHTALSANLNPADMAGKYEYSYDIEQQQDVFFINKTRLNAIDQSKGAETNSLAVKILEHLSAYYHQSIATKGRIRRGSLEVHNFPNKGIGDGAAFIGQLFGLPIHRSLSGINEVIKIKAIYPTFPIYVAMTYEKADGRGKLHVRHALRVDKVLTNNESRGGYDFVLINPWNTQSSERYDVAQLKQRQSNFYLFDLSYTQYELLQLLMPAPKALGRTIFANHELLTMVLQIKTDIGASFCLKDIEYCVALFNKNNRTPHLFQQLTRPNQQNLAEGITHTKHQPEHPWRHQILHYFENAEKNFPIQQWVAATAESINYYSYWSQCNQYWFDLYQINLCVNLGIQYLKAYPVSFEHLTTCQDIDTHRQHLMQFFYAYFINEPHLTEAEKRLGIPHITKSHPWVIQAVQEKLQEIVYKSELQTFVVAQAQQGVQAFGLFAPSVSVQVPIVSHEAVIAIRA